MGKYGKQKCKQFNLTKELNIFYRLNIKILIELYLEVYFYVS